MADTLDLRRVMRCAECGQRFGPDGMFCPFDGSKLEPQDWDPSKDPLVGKVVDGRYQVLGVLGEGGMGTVYKVRHTSLDRHFAMKVLRNDLAREADLAARFTREAQATASVKHPNVVAISDFGHLDGTSAEGAAWSTRGADVPYFVMELLSGQTLARAIKTGGPIPAALAVRIALKIAAGLGAAHDAKIVHRDLKPDNVFVLGNQTGPSREVDVRVVDFGAAMIVGASRVTKTGIVFGTPHYMSPEQASGQPVDHRADIYALGVILYEMFTGRVPFEADTYMGVLTQHMFVKPIPPSEVSERAKELGALEQVTLRALEKKPEHRYATMRELAADIERVTSFAPDGSLRVQPSPRSSSGSAYPMANALEIPAADEVNASAGQTTGRRRRSRARAWVLYGCVALGVATASVVAIRLLQPRDAEAPAPTTLTRTLAAPPEPAPSPVAIPPPPAEVATVAPATTSSAPAPATAAPPRPRPRPTSAGKKPPTSSIGTDFPDPWAK